MDVIVVVVVVVSVVDVDVDVAVVVSVEVNVALVDIDGAVVSVIVSDALGSEVIQGGAVRRMSVTEVASFVRLLQRLNM